MIWKATLNVMPLIRDNILWRIGNGSLVRIGCDPWLGSGNALILPEGLVRYLNSRGIKYLAQIGDQQHSTIFSQAWIIDRQWQLTDEWNSIWKDYIQALTESHIRLKEDEDELIWDVSKSGHYVPKIGYYKLIQAKNPDTHKSWWSALWHLQAQP